MEVIYGREPDMRWYLTEQQNKYYRQCGDKAVLQINKYWWHTSITYTWIHTWAW